MRTYSRKRKQEDSILEDVDELCRLCLAKAEKSEPIYPQTENHCAVLPMRIMICLGYEIIQDENLPSSICIACHDELERYYKFRKKCEKSYIRLKAHLIATKYQEHLSQAQENDSSLQTDAAVLYTAPGTGVQEEPQTQVDDLERLVIADIYHVEKEEHAAEQLTRDHDTGEHVMEQNEINPDISTFLNAILVELGVVETDPGGLRPRDLRARFQLETGDGDQIDFQLLEEDEDSEDAETVLGPADAGAAGAESSDALTDQAEILSKGKGKMRCTWCSVCGRTFGSRGAARRHASVHTGARPHACPDCGRTFAQKVVMKRHRLVHMKSRPFKCGQCPKSFTQHGALVAHARSHAAPHTRPLTLHACDYCDRMFLYASGLSRHMVTHSGRAFSCDVCARPFNDKSSLVRHARTHAHTTTRK